VAYDEKDLASVNEAAELMGINLGDFNIEVNKNGDDGGRSSDPIHILPVVQLLESSGNEDVVMTEMLDQSLLLAETVAEEIDDSSAANESMVMVNAELLDDILGENKETLAEQVRYDQRVTEDIAEENVDSTVMDNVEALNDMNDENTEQLFEEAENIGDGSVVDELPVAEEMVEHMEMENVQTLVDEVERMGANIETLAEEIDNDKADNSETMINEEEAYNANKADGEKIQEVNDSSNILTEKSKNIMKTLPDVVILKDKQSMEGSSKIEKILEKQSKIFSSKCDICHKYFKRPQGLLRHKEKFHKEEMKTGSNLLNVQQIKSEVTDTPADNNKMGQKSIFGVPETSSIKLGVRETSSKKVTVPETSSIKVTVPETSSIKVTVPETLSIKVVVPETSSIIACKYCGKVFRSATSNYPLLVAKANLQRHLEKHERDNHKGKNLAASKDDKDGSKRKDTSPPLGNSEPLSKLAKTPTTAVIPPTVRDVSEQVPKLNKSNPKEGLQKYECKQCTKSFSTKEMYGMHQKIHLCQEKAQSQKKFTCEKCGKCFLFEEKLEKHMLFHNPKPVESQQNAYKCDICSKSFAKMDRLHLHRSYHTNSEQQNLSSGAKNNANAPKGITSKFVCDYCDEGFDDSNKLKEHKLETHPMVKKEIISPISTKNQSKLPIGSNDKINKINKMLSQLVKKEVDTQSFFTCEKCGESFPSMEVLETHRETSHETYECNGCDKTFETENELMGHIVVHINDGNRENRASELSSPDGMEISQDQNNIDAGSKYLCTTCDLEFEDDNELFAHSSIHNGEKEKYLHCDTCDMDFQSENEFKNHNRAHTEEMLLTVRMPTVDITKNNVLCFKF